MGERVANWFNGLFRDSYRFPGSRSGSTRINGVFVDVDGVGVEASSSRSVYGVGVLRLEAFTVLTLSEVNRACEWFGNVNLDVSVVGVLSARFNRSKKILQVSS